MKQLQADVTAFMRAAGQDVPTHPTILPLDVRVLRAKLIMEEALEQVDALGIQTYLVVPGRPLFIDADSLFFREGETPDLTRIADGAVDQLYVSIGSCCAFGLNLERIWTLVQAANMAKFGPGSFKRPDGKVMKPPGWLPPDSSITDELKRQCTEGNSL